MIWCYTEKAPNAWHRRGTQKAGNSYMIGCYVHLDLCGMPGVCSAAPMEHTFLM